MKVSTFAVYAFLLSLCVVSCSKNVSPSGCTAQYIAPTIKFNIVDKTNGTDLFFSAFPNYSVNDIKIRFKNEINKLDSITPTVESSGTNKHFVYSVSVLRTSDTCYIQIRGIQSNAVYYTTLRDNSPCKVPSVNTVKIDNGTIINYDTNNVLAIKK